jgi:hypothetical protein
MKSKLIFLIFLLNFLYAKELIVVSSAIYNLGGNEVVSDIISDKEGNIIVVGNRDGSCIFGKYDKYLNQIQGSIRQENNLNARFVTLDELGNIIVGGKSTSASGDFLTIKYSPNLVVISSAIFDTGNDDEGNWGVCDNLGNVFVGGSTFLSNKDFFIIKYDVYLTSITTKRYDSGEKDILYSACVDRYNNIIAIGESKKDAYIVKYDKNLNEIKFSQYDSGGYDVALDVVVDSQNNYIICGWSYNLDLNKRHAFILKYDSNLENYKYVIYEDTTTDVSPVGITVDTKDNIILCGYKFSGELGTPSTSFFVVRYDQNLSHISSFNFFVSAIPNKDAKGAITTDKDGNIIVAFTNENYDWQLAKFNGPPKIDKVSEAKIGENCDIEITGVNFANGCVIKFPEGISLNNIKSLYSNRIIANIQVSSSVVLGKKNVYIENTDGLWIEKSDALNVVLEKNILSNQSYNFVVCADFGEVITNIDEGTFSNDNTIRISLPDNIDSSYFLMPQVYIEITSQLLFQKPLRLSFKYRPEYIGNYINSKLIFSYYNETEKKLEPLVDSIHYPQQNLVVGNIFKSGIYTLYPIQPNLKNIKVYPNPYKPSNEEFSNTQKGEGILFTSLTPDFKIMIFDISGKLVFEEEKTSTEGEYLWNTKDINGKYLPSGIYIYYIYDLKNKNEKVSGKIGIIR